MKTIINNGPIHPHTLVGFLSQARLYRAMASWSLLAYMAYHSQDRTKPSSCSILLTTENPELASPDPTWAVWTKFIGSPIMLLSIRLRLFEIRIAHTVKSWKATCQIHTAIQPHASITLLSVPTFFLEMYLLVQENLVPWSCWTPFHHFFFCPVKKKLGLGITTLIAPL